jgi:transketolase
MELAASDRRIVLLTGDLGYTVLEPFARQFPTRFFNVGVAEQNMIGVATGLASAGYIPYAYSIATFASLRPYEFIRNGPVLHQVPVRIMAIGGGFEYGSAGPTHHALEDVAVMRVQPGLTVIAPADAAQARTALLATWDLPGPIYYRLGKDDASVVKGLNGRFALDRVDLITDGEDVLLVVTGAIATEAVAGATALAAEGISAGVAVVSTFNPPPIDDLVRLAQRFRAVVTIEAHYITGGLGSLVAEVIEHSLSCRLVRLGVRSPSDGVSGSAGFLHQRHGLTSAAIASAARATVRERVG